MLGARVLILPQVMNMDQEQLSHVRKEP
jgi:hypothetical protein